MTVGIHRDDFAVEVGVPSDHGHLVPRPLPWMDIDSFNLSYFDFINKKMIPANVEFDFFFVWLKALLFVKH